MTQTRIDSLSQELDKRNNEITHLLKNLKEAETALVRTATLRFIPNHFLFADDLTYLAALVAHAVAFLA